MLPPRENTDGVLRPSPHHHRPFSPSGGIGAPHQCSRADYRLLREGISTGRPTYYVPGVTPTTRIDGALVCVTCILCLVDAKSSLFPCGGAASRHRRLRATCQSCERLGWRGQCCAAHRSYGCCQHFYIIVIVTTCTSLVAPVLERPTIGTSQLIADSIWQSLLWCRNILAFEKRRKKGEASGHSLGSPALVFLLLRVKQCQPATPEIVVQLTILEELGVAGLLARVPAYQLIRSRWDVGGVSAGKTIRGHIRIGCGEEVLGEHFLNTIHIVLIKDLR